VKNDHRNPELSQLSDDLLAEIDPSLDIPETIQRHVLAFQANRANGTDREILGLPEGADANAVKRAYFALSRQFHPDRYFGKNIGVYEDRLGAVFQQISDAYHGLTSALPKMAMAESLDRPESVEESAPDAAAKAEAEARNEAEKRAQGERARVARRKARREALERARKRRPFNPYRSRAETLLDEVERQLERKAFKDADGTLRLAKSFVQGDRALKRRLKELRKKLEGCRA